MFQARGKIIGYENGRFEFLLNPPIPGLATKTCMIQPISAYDKTVIWYLSLIKDEGLLNTYKVVSINKYVRIFILDPISFLSRCEHDKSSQSLRKDLVYYELLCFVSGNVINDMSVAKMKKLLETIKTNPESLCFSKNYKCHTSRDWDRSFGHKECFWTIEDVRAVKRIYGNGNISDGMIEAHAFYMSYCSLVWTFSWEGDQDTHHL